MIRTSATRTAALALSLLLASCAGDGGGRGSGISTAQGNVSRIVTAAHRSPGGQPRSLLARLHEMLPLARVANARTGVEQIRISVEGTDFGGMTDVNGFFAVIGTFDGPIALVFQRPQDGVTARMVVSVPAGGLLTLTDVEIDNRDGSASAAGLSVRFEAVVVATDCPSGRAEVVSRRRPRDGHPFNVEIAGALRDENGNPIDCGELGDGDLLDVSGVVADDETIEASEATLREGQKQEKEKEKDKDENGDAAAPDEQPPRGERRSGGPPDERGRPGQ